MTDHDPNQVDPKVGQTAEGIKIPFVDETHIDASQLKVFEFDSPDQEIKIETPEFSAVCPFSGLPDIANVVVKYRPITKKALELKALKYYFTSFRPVGIYQEGVTARIHRDLCAVLGHDHVKVTTTYNVRGGMYVECKENGTFEETV